jgi:hypothetical protein
MVLRIEPRLPSRLGPGDDVSCLIGAQIKRIGTADWNGDEVFAIEYATPDGAEGLAIFLFSELGLWKLP